MSFDPAVITVYSSDPTTSLTCEISSDGIPINIRAINEGGREIDLTGDNYLITQGDRSLVLHITLEKSSFDELEGATFICEAFDPNVLEFEMNENGNLTEATTPPPSVFEPIASEYAIFREVPSK